MTTPQDKEIYFIPADDEHQAREKAKAYELRQTQWWKNQLGTNICFYCKKNIPAKLLTMDHKHPIIRGGKSTRKNVVPCCKNCNNQKKFYLTSEWSPSTSSEK